MCGTGPRTQYYLCRSCLPNPKTIPTVELVSSARDHPVLRGFPALVGWAVQRTGTVEEDQRALSNSSRRRLVDCVCIPPVILEGEVLVIHAVRKWVVWKREALEKNNVRRRLIICPTSRSCSSVRAPSFLGIGLVESSTTVEYNVGTSYHQAF